MLKLRDPVKERSLYKMTKRATFFSSVSSVKGYVRAQTSLITMLGLVLGMFMYTSPAYAQSSIVVKLKSLGQARSAAVLSRGQQVDGCKTTSDTITGNVDGNGMFSVNFYFTPDCTGTRAKFFRFSIPQGSEGGTVTCQKSDNADFGVDCKLKLKDTSSSPSSSQSTFRLLTVQFDDLPDGTLSGGILNSGLVQVGDCATKATTLQVPIDGQEFTLVLFKNPDCTGGSKRSRRFSFLNQQPEGSLSCRSNSVQILFGLKPLN
jgi:hypothetical protein